MLSRCLGQVIHVLLTRAPLVSSLAGLLPFDLHVLSMPPAFVLSQDQTLMFWFFLLDGSNLFLTFSSLTFNLSFALFLPEAIWHRCHLVISNILISLLLVKLFFYFYFTFFTFSFLSPLSSIISTTYTFTFFVRIFFCFAVYFDASVLFNKLFNISASSLIWYGLFNIALNP